MDKILSSVKLTYRFDSYYTKNKKQTNKSAKFDRNNNNKNKNANGELLKWPLGFFYGRDASVINVFFKLLLENFF